MVPPAATSSAVTGRFAPSPTGDLHLGNVRTALFAWLSARSRGGQFRVRMEDLDLVASHPDHERSQLADLASLGLHHDGPVIRQSERFEIYERSIARLDEMGLVYRCYCTRREVREAASAPHGEVLRYPGTCRDLNEAERRDRESAGRRPALRLRTDGDEVTVVDEVAGSFVAPVDDIVLRRNDGVPAYHVAVVVDDALQDVTEVVRGGDLLPVTPNHVHLQRLLGLPTPRYAHVPLVVGPDGDRLAKRHGSVTLAALRRRGVEPRTVLGWLAASLALCEPDDRPSLDELVSAFSPEALPRSRWMFDPEDATSHP